MTGVDEVKVVSAYGERATLRVGDVFPATPGCEIDVLRART